MTDRLRFRFEVEDPDLISDLNKKKKQLIKKFKSLKFTTLSDLNTIFDLCKYELHRQSFLQITYPANYNIIGKKIPNDIEIVIHILPAVRDFSTLHKNYHSYVQKKP